MRDVLHAIATALVIAIAAVCTMVQVADVQHALHRLQHDESSVQQVDRGQDTGPGTGQQTDQETDQQAGRNSPRDTRRR